MCVCVLSAGRRECVPEPSKSSRVVSLPRDSLNLQGVSGRSPAVGLKSSLPLESAGAVLGTL